MMRVLVLGMLPFVLGCPLQTSTTTSSTMPRGGGGSSANVTVPDIVGKTQSEAEAAVASAGLRGGIKIGNDPGTWTASSKVCTQTPGPGQQSAPSLFVSVRFCLEEKPYVDDEGMLLGMTIEAAKKKAVADGFTGKIEVGELYEFDKDCKDGTVCRFEPRRWYLNQDHTLHLYVNRKLSISAPE